MCFREDQETYVLANWKFRRPTDDPRLPDCDRYSMHIHPTGGPAREDRPFGAAGCVERAAIKGKKGRHTRRLSRKHSAFSSTISLRIRSLGSCSKARVNIPGPTRIIVSPTDWWIQKIHRTWKCFNDDVVFRPSRNKGLRDLGRCLRITNRNMVLHCTCCRRKPALGGC